MTVSLESNATTTSSPEDQTLSARELAGDSDRALWNAFVGARPEGDVLQAWEWGAVKSPDWTPLRLAVFRDGAIAAGAAILKRSLPLVGAFYYAPRGPLLADWDDSAALKALLAAIREKASADRAAFLKIDPALPVERADLLERLKSHGFRVPTDGDVQGFGGTQPRCVMQLDLEGRTAEELLAAFKAQTRRNIKLGRDKHGVEVVGETTREDLTVFHELYLVTAGHHGFRPRPLSYFQKVWDNLFPAGMAKLFLTRYEGQVLSGALCFRIADKAWYVYGGTSNEHRNVMANYAMQWDMIQWARNLGCMWYDFRGVSPRRRQEGEAASDVEKEDHLQGLNRFKEGFSPRYVEYIGEWDLVYDPFRYWAYTKAKPAAQRIVRKFKRK